MKPARGWARPGAGPAVLLLILLVAFRPGSPVGTPAPAVTAPARDAWMQRPDLLARPIVDDTPVPAPLPRLDAPQPSPIPAATPVPRPATIRDLEEQTPGRDLADLARRLRHAVAPTTHAEPVADHPVGFTDTFYVADQANKRYFATAATVRQRSAHAYFYIQDDLPYDAAALDRAAQAFEAQIYPTDRSLFGEPRSPGIDGDPRISIVNAAVPGVGGYFSVNDEYPRFVVPYSNERNAIYINVQATRIGSPQYLSTIAHELQHMIHANVRPHDDSWFNEGMSMLAEHLNGFAVGSIVPAFLAMPDVQLDAWAPDPPHAIPHYGAAYLFLTYLLEHYGGPQPLKELLASAEGDLPAIDAFLQRRAGRSVDDVFADWVAANELNAPGAMGGRFAYQDTSLHVAPPDVQITPGAVERSAVRPYATRYFALPRPLPAATLRFRGATTVPLMQQPFPPGALEWWSNRGDTMDTTLTRPLDLRGLGSAHLDFSLWLDIEDRYDYFFVEVSADEGTTWQTLAGTHSTTADPNGQNYGNGYTGASAAVNGGPVGWWDEEVDLAPFVGHRVLVRLEYITDEAYSGPGVAIRNLRIPELGLDDEANGHLGWTARGWLLTSNAVPERFVVQVIAHGHQPQVIRVPLDGDNAGSLDLAVLGPDIEQAVVAVSALAPKTSEAGTFSLSLAP